MADLRSRLLVREGRELDGLDAHLGVLFLQLKRNEEFEEGLAVNEGIQEREPARREATTLVG